MSSSTHSHTLRICYVQTLGKTLRGREMAANKVNSPCATGIHNPPGETDKYSNHKRISHALMGDIQSRNASPDGCLGKTSWKRGSSAGKQGGDSQRDPGARMVHSAPPESEPRGLSPAAAAAPTWSLGMRRGTRGGGLSPNFRLPGPQIFHFPEQHEKLKTALPGSPRGFAF